MTMTARVKVRAGMIGIAMLCVFPRLAPAPPRVPVTYDPNDPDKTRTIISREEREKLGLTPRTWSAVVHPDVYATLDRLNKTVASLKDRLKKGRDVQAFDALRRIRFQGMVYVQVQVRPDPNIRDVQRRVLASLKASEFHVRQLFDGAAGFVGYATKEGVDKLAKNADVVGVCLDDQPLPKKGKTIYKDDLPPPKPGDTASTQPGVKERKVDPDVYGAFALTDRVDVMVSLRGDSLPKLSDLPSNLRARHALQEQAAKQLQDRVLSTIAADEFWVWTRFRLTSGMTGFITKEGLEKLWKHPDVQRIYLQHILRPAVIWKKKP